MFRRRCPCRQRGRHREMAVPWEGPAPREFPGSGCRTRKSFPVGGGWGMAPEDDAVQAMVPAGVFDEGRIWCSGPRPRRARQLRDRGRSRFLLPCTVPANESQLRDPGGRQPRYRTSLGCTKVNFATLGGVNLAIVAFGGVRKSSLRPRGAQNRAAARGGRVGARQALRRTGRSAASPGSRRFTDGQHPGPARPRRARAPQAPPRVSRRGPAPT